MTSKVVDNGLAGIVAAETEISSITEEHGGLSYRGISVKTLAEKCSFDEVAYLLLYSELPNRQQLNDFIATLNKSRSLPSPLEQTLRSIKDAENPMDVLRAAVAILGCIEPEDIEQTNYNQHEVGIRLFALLPAILGYWYILHTTGSPPPTIQFESPSTVDYLLTLLQGPGAYCTEVARCLNVSLILYAEHELNASAFTARVIASTKSDVHSAVTGAIGALKGPLHGGANEAAMKMLEKFTSEEVARTQLEDMKKRKVLVMGFGHRLYKDGDPRSDIIKECSRRLSLRPGGDRALFKMSEFVENWMVTNKRIYPNLDFYSASAYKQCKIGTELFTPLFAISRVTGWLAHIFEQRRNNKLIRPSSVYIGETQRPFIALDNRPGTSHL